MTEHLLHGFTAKDIKKVEIGIPVGICTYLFERDNENKPMSFCDNDDYEAIKNYAENYLDEFQYTDEEVELVKYCLELIDWHLKNGYNEIQFVGIGLTD